MPSGIGLPLACGGGGEGGREGGGLGRGPGLGGGVPSPLGILFHEVGVPSMPPGFCALPVLFEAA